MQNGATLIIPPQLFLPSLCKLPTYFLCLDLRLFTAVGILFLSLVKGAVLGEGSKGRGVPLPFEKF